ncbi:MAG TPA: hypothetical protein VHZ51_02170 [Ktedonobacteraceae bacterium]|nr:hypothetical protein [Ktedonobacteraceae bacterium]
MELLLLTSCPLRTYLTSHHTRLGITVAHNRIPTKRPIREVLSLCEDPSDLVSLRALVAPSSLPEDSPSPEKEECEEREDVGVLGDKR